MKNILFIILFFLSNCGLFDKKVYITNLNGVYVQTIDKPGIQFMPFGQKIQLKREGDNPKEWIGYLHKGELFRISELDFSEKPLESIFCNRLQGLRLSDGEIIPYKERLILEGQDMQNEQTFLKFKFKNKSLSMLANNFSMREPKLYFHVTAKAGLNLREGAGQEFKKILTLPYGSKGPIISAKSEILKIQNRTGFWTEVKFQDKAGWIFSGFAVMSENEDWKPAEITSTENYDTSGGDYIFQNFENDSSLQLSGNTISSYNFQNTKVELKELKVEEEYQKECGMKQGLSIQSSNGNIYIQDYELELKRANSISSGFIFFSGRPCGCCCAPYGDKLLAITNSGLKFFLYSDKDEARCDTIEADFLEAVSSNKFRLDSTTNTILLLRELPICNRKAFIGPDDYDKFEKVGSKHYFYVFQNNKGILKEERMETEPGIIPTQWQSLWEKAKDL